MLTKAQQRLQRWERILLSLDRFEYATRKQLQQVNNLKGTKNALRILKEMEEEGLINSYRRECKIYYLSKKGKNQIGSKNDTPGKHLMEHILNRNDLYIYLGQPKTWQTERPISMRKGMDKIQIIPDAIFNEGKQYYFVEVDRTQTISKNKQKIDLYAELKHGFKQQFGREPILIYYVMTQNRKKMIEGYAKDKIKCKVFSSYDLQ